MAQNQMIKNKSLRLWKKLKIRMKNNIVKIGHLYLKVIKLMAQNRMSSKSKKKITK